MNFISRNRNKFLILVLNIFRGILDIIEDDLRRN